MSRYADFRQPVRKQGSYVKGLAAPMRAIDLKIATVDQAIEYGLKSAGAIIIKHARKILQEEVYEPRGETLSGRLYGSFRRQPPEVGAAIGHANVTNTAPEAYYLEHGTDSHYIPVGEKGFLAWEENGQVVFSNGHDVSGVKPIHFMERAMLESELEIWALFAYILQQSELPEDTYSLEIESDMTEYHNAELGIEQERTTISYGALKTLLIDSLSSIALLSHTISKEVHKREAFRHGRIDCVYSHPASC